MYILSNVLDLEKYKKKYPDAVIKSISHDYPAEFDKDEIEDWGLFSPPRSFLNKYYSGIWNMEDLKFHYIRYLDNTWPTYCYLGGSQAHLNVIIVIPNTEEYIMIGNEFMQFMQRNGFQTEVNS